MAQIRMVAHLIQVPELQRQAGGYMQLEGFSLNDRLQSAMAHVCELLEFVDGEEIPDAIAEILGDVSGILAKGFCGIPGLPASLVLQRLRQVPVVERREGLDFRGLQLV